MRVRFPCTRVERCRTALPAPFPIHSCQVHERLGALFQRLDGEPEAILDLAFLREVEISRAEGVSDTASVPRFAFAGVDLLKGAGAFGTGQTDRAARKLGPVFMLGRSFREVSLEPEDVWNGRRFWCGFAAQPLDQRAHFGDGSDASRLDILEGALGHLRV